MAELRSSHLRYLLAIYELGRLRPDVGIQDITKTLNCTKASVTKMMGILMVNASIKAPLVQKSYRNKAKIAFTLKAQKKRMALVARTDTGSNPYQMGRGGHFSQNLWQIKFLTR